MASRRSPPAGAPSPPQGLPPRGVNSPRITGSVTSRSQSSLLDQVNDPSDTVLGNGNPLMQRYYYIFLFTKARQLNF